MSIPYSSICQRPTNSVPTDFVFASRRLRASSCAPLSKLKEVLPPCALPLSAHLAVTPESSASWSCRRPWSPVERPRISGRTGHLVSGSFQSMNCEGFRKTRLGWGGCLEIRELLLQGLTYFRAFFLPTFGRCGSAAYTAEIKE